jgi:Asp-tRNA(Asn)/Glu-tRNA(Gln) amidotransferase A subunit family amidase
MRTLHCIPVILKDNFDTADGPTEAGSIALRGSVPPDDAFMVQPLRAEDAIILAKSNMGEWAFSPYEAVDDLRQAGAVIVDPFRILDFERLTSATGFCSRFRCDLNRHLRTLGPVAPIRSLDQVAASKRFLPQSAGVMQWAMGVDADPKSQQPPCVDVQGDPRRKALLDAVVAAMDRQRVDVIVYPSWSNPPRRIGDSESPRGNNSPVIAPQTGQPAITAPMGFTRSGRPLGLQLLARPFDEHKPDSGIEGIKVDL